MTSSTLLSMHATCAYFVLELWVIRVIVKVNALEAGWLSTKFRSLARRLITLTATRHQSPRPHDELVD